jgi:hypothetical protein
MIATKAQIRPITAAITQNFFDAVDAVADIQWVRLGAFINFKDLFQVPLGLPILIILGVVETVLAFIRFTNFLKGNLGRLWKSLQDL